MNRSRTKPRSAVPAALAILTVLLPLLPVVLLVLPDAGGLAAGVTLAATTAAGAALVVCALVAARCVPAVPPTRVRTALRDRDRRTAFLPQRDPDARGRTRPRAPGHALPATAAQGT
ncbi:DUF6412 domain-containing protein [Streptomyces viridosporus]|uniref:DUF6412 domain-containing protein n=1 Tax=Streptomyces viridosporus TaxID=67581 RepID=UPI0009BD50D7|nr:DUF6412 domain-containing protein [Streptomyces viridosporus]